MTEHLNDIVSQATSDTPIGSPLEAATDPLAGHPTDPPAEPPTEPPTQSLTADEIFAVADGYRLTAAVVALTELRVPDALAAGPRSAEDLAKTLGVSSEPLGRLLAMLASRGALVLDGAGRYANTGLSEVLVSGPMRDMVLGWSALPGVVRAWHGLAQGIRAGRSPFPLVNNMGFHDYLASRPEEAAAYDHAMSSTMGGFADVAAALDLRPGQTVVAVGGGNGTELVPILERFPAVRAVLVDLPDTVPAARAALADLGIQDRVEIVPSDARERVPEGDAYVMSTVLRCLEDASVVQLLRSCRRAARPGATLHAAEMPVPDGPPQHPSATMDLTAWVAYGGGDRTVAQWRGLFAAGGWMLTEVVPLTEPYSLLNAVLGDT
jgi:hypothetical protein